MAYDDTDAGTEGASGSWRRVWASAGAILATIALILLIVLVTLSNRNRDDALQWERHTYDVMLLTRTVDATIARSEAALGRFILDERQESGTLYYNEWRLAGRQIGGLQRLVRDPEQRARLVELRQLYAKRGEELGPAASRAAAKRGNDALSFFYQAGLSPTGPALRAKLASIASSERDALRQRMAETRMFAEEAERFTEWLAWLGILIGMSAIGLGFYAYSALTERVIARRQAESEAIRATALERAVQDRTRELRDANERLLAEATEREAAEAQLRQVQKMEAVGQLTGGIAHDFNNMLAVIVGGLDLAKRKLRGPRRDVEFHLDNAMEGATRAAALTRRLLAFARSEPLLPKGIAPAALVENMLDLIDRAMGERIVVRTHFPDEEWSVWADSNQLENAILNLCVNGRDAMNGEGQIDIAIANVTLAEGEIGAVPAGDYVRISVADTGSGIAPENLQRVFEPFFTTKPVGKGTGLGLSQIFGFARQSGGDVTVDSTPDVGTTMAIYLPRSLRVADEGRDPGTAATLGPARQPTPAGTRILVVEDDPRVSRSTVGALEELGYLPIACASGAEALEILAADDGIELVITDVMMPEMTGPELVRVVSAIYPHIGLLFVTGFVGEAGEAEELAGHQILRKPFTVAALADAVVEALARRLSVSHPASASAAAE
jgi:signal transduction histidine kinase/CheY-like chemotaxis protein